MLPFQSTFQKRYDGLSHIHMHSVNHRRRTRNIQVLKQYCIGLEDVRIPTFLDFDTITNSARDRTNVFTKHVVMDVMGPFELYG